MQPYEPGTPRALIGIVAVALTVATLAVSVVAPAAQNCSTREIGVVASSADDIAALRTTADHVPSLTTSIDVVAVRGLRYVPVVQAHAVPAKGKLQG